MGDFVSTAGWVRSSRRMTTFGLALLGLLASTAMRVSAAPGTPESACSATWSEARAPRVPAPDALNAVSAVSPADAWAVGTSPVAAGNQTLAIHWTGTSWKSARTPNPGTEADQLLGVADVSSSDAWAVGFKQDRGSPWLQTLALKWDGSRWRSVLVAEAAMQNNVLTAVSARGPSDVWAVGYYLAFNSQVDTLVEHWDGTSPGFSSGC
jgi:hypothetical protein